MKNIECLTVTTVDRYRTKKLLRKLAAMRIPDRPYDYTLRKRLVEETMSAYQCVMYEWPWASLLTPSDLEKSDEREFREYPATLRLLVAMRRLPVPKRTAVDYIRKKLATFRDMAKKALPEWGIKEEDYDERA